MTLDMASGCIIGAMAAIELLTPREQEVLGLVAQGKRNQEISDDLCIALKTTKNHVASILDKLGVASRVHAAVLYQKESGPGADTSRSQ